MCIDLALITPRKTNVLVLNNVISNRVCMYIILAELGTADKKSIHTIVDIDVRVIDFSLLGGSI